jgi:hypothetical protein
MDHALRIGAGCPGAALDARLDLRIGGAPMALETEARLIARLTRSLAPWSAFLDVRPEEAAFLFERLCASDVTALERKLGATVIVEELRIGEPRDAAADGALWLRIGLEDEAYGARLSVASGFWRDRIRAWLARDADESDEAVVALGPIAGAAEALAVGDVVLLAGAEQALKAVVWTQTQFAPARLGVDALVLERAFAPRPERDAPGGYVEIGRLACDASAVPGVRLAFRPYESGRARYVVAGRLRAIGRLVSEDGELGFAVERLEGG